MGVSCNTRECDLHQLPTLSVMAGETRSLDNQLLAVIDAPTEVVVRQPVTIVGSFPVGDVTQIMATTFDHSTLAVAMNIGAGEWQIDLPDGFNSPGTPFIRVQGMDLTGVLVSEKVVSIAVKPEALRLVTKQSTLFKTSPADSMTLAENQKVLLGPEETVELQRFGTVDGHYKVWLTDSIDPVGSFGYFYIPHVDLIAPVTLTIKQDTLFKISSAPSSSLAPNQKFDVKAGTKFTLDGDYFVENHHVKVTLNEMKSPFGKVGYLFIPHVTLEKLGQVVPLGAPPTVETITSVGAVVTIKTDTFCKASAAGSRELPEDKKILLKAGTKIPIAGYAAVDGHFRVRFASPLAPVGNVGFFFWQHVTITKDGKTMSYDPEMRTMTVKQSTILKKRPVESRQLAANEQSPLAAGQVYGLDSFSLSDTHFQVALNESVGGVGKTGFIFAGHVTLKQGNKVVDINPKKKVLGVPYFSQRDNPRDPFVTCNVTSVAMALWFHGVRPRNSNQQLEDELYQWIIDRYGASSRTDNSVLNQMYNAYGFDGGFSTSRTWAQIRQEIAANRPVVIGGYFTHGGHIVCIIGYDEQGFIVNDPYGDALTGYAQTEGAGLSYPYTYMQEMCGSDGDVWAHFIVPRRK